jgi:hypothetical protein
MASVGEGSYRRLPILLTSDFAGAAQLMEQLAATLRVPYLYCADADGWRTEARSATKRPPLRVDAKLKWPWLEARQVVG